MNDYLTNLAARALAPVPAIVPRQGSLFEPADARPEVAAPRRAVRRREQSLEESLEHETSPEDHVSPIYQVPTTRAAQSRRAPAEEVPHIFSERQIAAERPVTRPAVIPMAVEPALAAAALAPPRVEIVFPPAAAKAPPVLDRAATVQSATREPMLAANPPQESPANPVRPMPRRERDTEDDEAHRSTRQSDHAQPRIAISPAVVVAARDRSDESALRPIRPLASARAPTIRVTIGRVEVRAIAPPAATPAKPRAAASPARLSLEDYLQERSGGRR